MWDRYLFGSQNFFGRWRSLQVILRVQIARALSMSIPKVGTLNHGEQLWQIIVAISFVIDTHTKNPKDPKAKKINHTFNAWDSDVLSQLPEYIRHAFPFLLTARSGIMLSMLDRFCDDMVHGIGFTSAREAIQQAHLARFYKLQVQYYDMLIFICS